MIGAVIGFHWYVRTVEQRVAYVTTWQPTRWIASGEVIDGAMVREVRLPGQAVVKDGLRRIEQIVGKSTLIPMSADEQFVAWKLSSKRVVPTGEERFVSFPTNEVTNVATMLRKGDTVDVYVEFGKAVVIGGQLRGAVKVIEALPVASVRTAEGIEVIARTDDVWLPFSHTPAMPPSSPHAATKPAINTFLMTPQVYEAYTLAQLYGQIKLTLSHRTTPPTNIARVTDDFRTWKTHFIHTNAEIKEEQS
jgi:hypothetical protein